MAPTNVFDTANLIREARARRAASAAASNGVADQLDRAASVTRAARELRQRALELSIAVALAPYGNKRWRPEPPPGA